MQIIKVQVKLWMIRKKIINKSKINKLIANNIKAIQLVRRIIKIL